MTIGSCQIKKYFKIFKIPLIFYVKRNVTRKANIDYRFLSKFVLSEQQSQLLAPLTCALLY